MVNVIGSHLCICVISWNVVPSVQIKSVGRVTFPGVISY